MGSFQDLDYINKDSEEYKMFKYVFENIIPPTKIIKWGDILEQRKNKSFIGFQGTALEAMHYLKYLPHLYTWQEREGRQVGQMDSRDLQDNFVDIRDYTELTEEQKTEDHVEISLNSMYYHSAKAHWLVQSIQEEGLRHPIQGMI